MRLKRPLNIYPTLKFQSTHSLRSATFCSDYGRPMYDVSIHALLAECDPQSDLPRHASTVSIHALLAECDVSMIVSTFPVRGFNPRTPCGVRPVYSRVPSPVPRFQSTHSLRSATNDEETLTWAVYVSIHALLAECDKPVAYTQVPHTGFNPRTPCGVRRL